MHRTLLATLLLTTALWADPGTEQSTQLKARDVLPAKIVSGVNSQVLDPVENDGYLNIYRLKSSFGESKVVSTATLDERVHEYDAIVSMDKLSGSNEFLKAVEGQGKKVVQGGINLVKDPVGTTKNAVSGVGRMFRSVGNALGGGPSTGDSTISEVSGFSKTKRAYAQAFHVDPYSRNQDLQDKLKDISRAGFLGGAVTSLGLGAVSGGVGVAIKVASTTGSLSDLVTSKSGEDLVLFDQDKLKKMGVNDDLADLFLKNENFTMTERTAIVLALDTMSKTKNRQAFIKFAVLTDNEDMASFRRHQAEMYAAYNQKQHPIREFHFFDQFAAALENDGSLLLMAPLDHLLWTDEIATYVAKVNQRLASQKVPRKLLWFTGDASPLALLNLKQAGWQVQQKAANLLQ